MQAASERGYRVLVEQSGSAGGAELSALQGAFRQLTDGLLFTPLVIDADTVAAQLGKKPLVMLGEHIMDSRFDVVTMKNEEAAAAVTAHLLQAGRRRTAVIGADPDESGGAGGRRRPIRRRLWA